jgi:hypothetical protein
MLRFLSLSVFSLGVSGTASGATFLVDVRCADFAPHVREGIGPVSTSCDVTNYPVELWGPSANPFSPAGTAQADSFAGASASPSGLGLSAAFFLFVTGAKSGDRGASTQTYAAWSFDDFVFSGPGSSPVPAALNLFVRGSMGGNVSTDDQGPLTSFVYAGGDVDITIKLNGAFAGNGFAFVNNANGTIRQEAFDLLEGFHGAGGGVFIASDDLLLPVGQFFGVEVELSAKANTGVRIEGMPEDEFDSVTASGGGVASFGNTVSFPTSGPVFNLPPGYTVNSVSAGIVDNRFVPEPGRIVLTFTGLIVLLAAHRLRTVRSRTA